MSHFFSQLKAFSSLQELAKNPIDLRREFTTARLEKYMASGGPFQLFFAAERISDPILKTLFDLAEEVSAVDQMAAMQSGEIVNQIQGYPSEQRPALHCAMRHLFGGAFLGKAEEAAANLAAKEIEKLKQIEKQWSSFTDLVQIGIGGSSLGPEAICLGLEAYHLPKRRVHFVSNVDPDELTKVISRLDLAKTLVVVVSKSGSTLETLTNELFAREKFQKAGLDPKNHFIAVTGQGSPLDDPQKYLASFYMWDYIGGRYSVTSMVGGVCLAFALGVKGFLEFLKGAREMDEMALLKDPLKNLPLLSALLGIWNRNFLHLPTVAIIPYSQALSRFPAHLQQLDMESNGKRIDKEGRSVDFETGPIIWGEPGTNGQHSFYQLIHQGTTTVPLEMIGFAACQYGEDIVVKQSSSQEKLLSNLFAQSIALATGEKSENPNKVFLGNRPNRILLGKRLTPSVLGALLAYYEHKVAFQGFIWNINSFDQEGVQLGKVLALKVIDQFAAKRGEKREGFPLGEFFIGSLA